MAKPATNPTASSEKAFVTVRQLAIMLQVSPRTLARMRRAGQLPAPVRRGGSVKWRMDEVARWLDIGQPPKPGV